MSAMNGEPQEYRLRPAVGLRMIGVGFLWLAAAVVLEALGRAVGTFDSAPFDVVRWLCIVAFLLITAVGLLAALSRTPWLTLDTHGFRNRLARPGRVRGGSWTDVSDVRHGPGGSLVITLSDSRTSLIPTVLLNSGAPEISAAISARLNDAHGYRAAR